MNFVGTLKALKDGGDIHGLLDPHNPYNAKRLLEECLKMEELGLTRKSRRGWTTMDHPVLKVVQWRIGSFGCFPTFQLRVAGTTILQAWPSAGKSRCGWMCAPPNISESWQAVVDQFLGNLQDGSDTSQGDWREQISTLISKKLAEAK